MGIFNKACPQCTADNAAGAIRCTCGFIFDTAEPNGAGPSPKETAEEEILFQEYLAARVSQAIEQATVATHAADVEPENEHRAVEAIRAQDVVEKAKVELAAQQARAVKATEAARKAELIVGAVPIRAKKPTNGSRVAKFGVAEVVEDDRLFKDYLAARKAQATVQRKTPIQNPAAGVRPGETTNEQIWPRGHEEEKWEVKDGVGKDSNGSRITLPSTATEAKRYPEWKRNGHTRTLPKNEIMALYSLQATSEKSVPKKSSAKISRPVTPTRSQPRPRPRPPSVVVPAMKVGLGVAAKTTAKGTKAIGKGIAKLFSKTVQATQHHVEKRAIPTLHTEVGVHPEPARPRRPHGAKAKRTTVPPSTRPSHRAPQARPLAKPKPAQELRTQAAPTRPKSTAPIKKNGVAHPRVNGRLGPSISNNNPIRRTQTQPKLSDSVPKQRSMPGRAFRAAQADKIAKAVDAARAMEESETNRDAFRAVQSKKIEKALSTARLMESLKASRECPLCTAALSADATDCRCGWAASVGELEMPGLTLSDQERIDTVGVPEATSCPVECPICTATVPAGVPNCGCGWKVPNGEREMPPLALSPDERSAIEHGKKIKRD